MTANLASPQHYPKISFKKCILYNHQYTISQLTFNASEQVLKNPTIKRCLDMHYKDQKYKFLSFLGMVALMKIGTKIVHVNRALALSAPRNWKSVLLKYVAIPYALGSYKYFNDIQRTIMQIQNAVDQDPEADELWQPIFQRKYPDPNQTFYSSPFTKFKLQDVMQGSSRASNVI